MFESLLDRLAAGPHAADRRGPEPREAITVAASLELDGTIHRAEITNISAGGLMASFDGPLEVGAPVMVVLDGQRLPGYVKWQHDGRFGMCFEHPLILDAATIERYRPANVETAKLMSRWMI